MDLLFFCIIFTFDIFTQQLLSLMCASSLFSSLTSWQEWQKSKKPGKWRTSISTLKIPWKYVVGHYAGAVSWGKYRTLKTILFTHVLPLSILMTPSDSNISNRGISLTKSYDLIILFFFLIQDLTMEPRNWFGTYDSPALASWVLRLQLCTAIHD